MQRLAYEEIRDLTRNVTFESFFTVLGNKVLKCRAITLHVNKTNFYKNLPLSVFELIIYQKR